MSEQETNTVVGTEEKLPQLEETTSGADTFGVEENNPAEVAAQMFSLYLEPFKNVVARLPKKSLQRVLNNLVEYPLQDGELKWSTTPEGQLERSVFLMGDKMLQAKSIMMLNVAYDAEVQALSTKVADMNLTENKEENKNEQQ